MTDPDAPEAISAPTRAGDGGTDDRYRRVLLVGFMGSGKTTVGREVARRVGWTFVDFDDEVEREVGDTVASIFERLGEPGFREIEARIAERLLHRERVVLASGGGWPATPGRMEATGSGTLTVWLQVTPDTAVARAGAQDTRRPLLEVDRPLAQAEHLLARRAPFYSKAELTLDSESATVAALAGEIVEALGSRSAPRAGDSTTVVGEGP